MTLTESQRQILRFLATFTKESGFPPSVREIAEAMDWTSTNAVTEQLQRLEKHGLLTRQVMVARSTVLTSAGKRVAG